MEQTEILSTYITSREMLNYFSTFKYEKIDVFGVTLRVPKKEAESFKRELDSLRTMIEILDVRVKIKGNHSLLQVQIGNFYYLNFHLFARGILYAGKKIKGFPKLKRVDLYDMRNDYDYKPIYEESNNFHIVLQFAIRRL